MSGSRTWARKAQARWVGGIPRVENRETWGTGREFRKGLRYIYRNPVERGLVLEAGDWKWSSFRHYALREKGVVEIESEWTARERERQAQGGAERILLIPG